VSDVVEVKNGIYGEGEDSLMGCGLLDNSSTELTFKWSKDGNEIHTDDRRTIAVHKLPDYSTLTVSKIGNNTEQGIVCCGMLRYLAHHGSQCDAVFTVQIIGESNPVAKV